MGHIKYKVQLDQKRKVAIAELVAIGYDQNEAMEILDTNSLLTTEFEKELSGFRDCPDYID